MKKLHHNIIKIPPLYIIHYILFIAVILSFINCTKTPTNSDNSNQTTVTGSISQNTTWSSGKDYIVEGIVTVEKGVSLNITGEVTVLFKADEQGNAGKLRINGSLQAKGTDSTSAVIFKPYDTSQEGDAWGIELDQSEGCGVFEFCRFEGLTYGVNAFEASVLVNECTFIECVDGVVVSKCDSALIQGSEFVDNDYGVKTNLSPVGDDSVRVIGNVFSGASEVGVEMYSYSKGFLLDNVFYNCKNGIYNHFNSNCDVVNNNFKQCAICCYFSIGSNGNIKKNNFISGNNAIKIEKANSNIIFNNFFSFNNFIIQFYHRNISFLIAENNWWNTINKEDIEKLILDAKDNINWTGIVDFEPFEYSEIIHCSHK